MKLTSHARISSGQVEMSHLCLCLGSPKCHLGYLKSSLELLLAMRGATVGGPGGGSEGTTLDDIVDDTHPWPGIGTTPNSSRQRRT